LKKGQKKPLGSLGINSEHASIVKKENSTLTKNIKTDI